jgi:hypothetical protein
MAHGQSLPPANLRPAPERGVHAASPHAQPHAQKFSNAPANSHIEAG